MRPPLLLASAALAFAALTTGVLAHDDDPDHGQSVRQKLQALEAKIEALQATVSTQQREIKSLQSSNASLQKQVGDLQTSNTALQKQLANAKNVLALAPFVSVDPNPQIGVAGPNITLKGVNIHIVSGSGATNDKIDQGATPTGLGNLIIGYDEAPPASVGMMTPGDRGGSHNLVIGTGHRFTQAASGGLVAGEINTISNEGASVSGGSYNTASGHWASVSGGGDNTASGEWASVSGGAGNLVSALEASVSGGISNAAMGAGASVSGGQQNTASGITASVSGGIANTAKGEVA